MFGEIELVFIYVQLLNLVFLIVKNTERTGGYKKTGFYLPVFYILTKLND